MIYYAGYRVNFDRIDREGLTGSLTSLPSMRLVIFIFKMKISEVSSDLAGRGLRLWLSRWLVGHGWPRNRSGGAEYDVWWVV